jgi:hypothetical protein
MFSGLNNPAANPVTSIEVIGNDDVDSGSLGAYGAAIQPADATNRDVIWTVIPETGSGSISSYGVFTGGKEGTVTIRATAADGSGVYGEKQVTVNHVDKQITFINLTSASGSTTLGSCGTLQINAALTPEEATVPNLKWSISESTPAGAATVAATGLVTAIKGGTVTVRATALDGSSTYGEIVLEITDQTGPMDDVVGLNGTYKTYCYNGAGRWMIENSKEGTPTRVKYGTNAEGERGYYYTQAAAATACPMSGWGLATDTQATAMLKYWTDHKAAVVESMPAVAFNGEANPDKNWGSCSTTVSQNAGYALYIWSNKTGAGIENMGTTRNWGVRCVAQ